MWLFTRYGFYSVVQDKFDVNAIQVRGRVEDDLAKLSTFAQEKADVTFTPVITTDHADYAYRIVVPKSDWFRVATALAQDIDYPNFKSEVHGERDRDDAYLDVWSAMHELQQARRRGTER